jgi:hypothetical protein
MKKIIGISLLIMLAVSVQGQGLKKFRVGITAGYAMPAGEGAKGGVCIALEPSYRINDAFVVGLRAESAIIARGFSEAVPYLDFQVTGLGSYTLNGQYYFKSDGFRPFAGLGFGLYVLDALEFEVDGVPIMVGESESKFGFYPRLGFDAGHFTMLLEYNFVPPTKAGTNEIKNSYIGIKIGVNIGGGRK